MTSKRTISAPAEADDDDGFLFLSEVATAAEAHALSHSKRFRSNPGLAANAAFTETKPQPQDGAYLAALRADDAPRHLRQQQQYRNFSSLPSRVKVVVADGGNHEGFGGDGACFKCGKPGHWARDCDFVVAAAAGGGGIAQSQPSTEPEKPCPCGLGNCVVLTANTEKNRGRRFYKCPVREENGGCGFFQWCDSASGMNNTTTPSYTSNFTSTFPNLPCTCGAGFCLILTAKTGNNAGRQFYRCPANQESSCGFFKWCNDQTFVAAATANNSSSSNMNTRSYGTTGGSSCFKCGKEGHWAKDCSLSADVSLGPVRSVANKGYGSSFSSTNINSYGTTVGSSCFKCGKEGHWAKDCSFSAAVNFNNMNIKSYGTTGGMSCFKCGKEGHWAKDCSSSADVPTASIKNPPSSSCYKCGNSGHWASDCTNSKH